MGRSEEKVAANQVTGGIVALVRLTAMVALIATYGCAGQGTMTGLPEEITDLMPAAAARKIVRDMWPSYGGGSEISGPVLSFGGGTQSSSSLRDVDFVNWFPNDQLAFGTRQYTYVPVCGVRYEDARNFAMALKSLGAPLTFTRYDGKDLRSCGRYYRN